MTPQLLVASLGLFFISSTGFAAAAEPELTIWASPTSLSAGSRATIAWIGTHVNWCHVYKKNNATDDVYGYYVQQNTVTGAISTDVLTETTTYTLGCDTASGLKTASVTIPVSGLPATSTIPPAPPTPAPSTSGSSDIVIWSSPPSVAYGQPSTIAWVASKVNFCHVYKKNNATDDMFGAYVAQNTINGNATTGPLTETSTYTIGCDTTGGLKTASVTIPVIGNTAGTTVVIEGESTSYVPHTFSGRGSWPEEVGAYWPAYNSATVFNVSAGGEKIGTMLGQYASEVHPRAAALGTKYFFLFAGINDIEAGRSAANIYNDLKTEWALARADGFKVVAFTLMPSTLYTEASGKYAMWQSLNALILSDTLRYDYLVRPEQVITSATDTTYLSDGIHTSQEGAGVIARLVADLLVPTHATVSTQAKMTTSASTNLPSTVVSIAATKGGSDCPSLIASLSRGMRDSQAGGHILQLQRFLTQHFALEPDAITTGYFGLRTENYVKKFQAQQGISAIGVVGPLTRAAIARVCGQ